MVSEPAPTRRDSLRAHVRSEFGRWLGIVMAGLGAISALMSIPAYPFWSLAIFAICILVIYGLAAYGGQQLFTD